MKTDKNILIAFLLNLCFSVFEFFGGLFSGSVAILSDALHDLGDAISIVFSFIMEKKSHKHPDKTFTYGYARYSVLGGFITTVILLFGSVTVICHAITRIFNPTPIHYDGMILFAVVGALVNLCAAFVTREGDSLNQKAVNLHMLEDVLGWLVVLVGAIIMRFTDIAILDPLMSIGVALFILIHAIRNLKEILDLFLEKAPQDICVEELTEHLTQIDGVLDVHHIHLWSMDEQHNYATMHVRINGDGQTIKQKIREELKEHGICHATLELETADELCPAEHCDAIHHHEECCHHHHHHHHHHH